jgi:hypothetical protein
MRIPAIAEGQRREAVVGVPPSAHDQSTLGAT